MLFETNKLLKEKPVTQKIIISLILTLAGFGYIFGFLNVYFTYNAVDGKPGMSIEDVTLSFYGGSRKTKLEKSIDGSMNQYFTSKADYLAVKNWITNGGKKEEYEKIDRVFEASCISCHSADRADGGVSLTSYDDTKNLLKIDKGKEIRTLIGLSHTHIPATLTIMVILLFFFWLTEYPDMVKNLVSLIALLAIALDIGSWWLAKVSPAFSVLVILGGASLGTSFAALTVLPLVDMWLIKKRIKTT